MHRLRDGKGIEERKMMDSLFDELDEPLEQEAPPAPEHLQEAAGGRTACPGSIPGAAPTWREVPQPLFLSWPESMQLAYCARRDEASALRADDAEETRWLLNRAKIYKEIM